MKYGALISVYITRRKTDISVLGLTYAQLSSCTSPEWVI